MPKSRYVVVSPGGPPASTALYGVQNCFDMALLGAIQQGGEALVLGPCNGRPGMADDVRGLAPDAVVAAEIIQRREKGGRAHRLAGALRSWRRGA